MKDFRSQISDFRLSAAELHPWFLTAEVKQSLGTRRKCVIPRRGDAEGPHKYRQNIFSHAHISMRGPSLSSQLGMTEEMNPE